MKIKLAVLIIAIALSPLVHAQYAPTAPKTQVVKFADLNLNTDRDVHRLYARVSNAADNTCPYYRDRSLRHAEIFKLCKQVTIQRAVYEVGNMRFAGYVTYLQDR